MKILISKNKVRELRMKDYAALAHDPKAVKIMLIWACQLSLKDRLITAWRIVTKGWEDK
jgi:hypothetical protein